MVLVQQFILPSSVALQMIIFLCGIVLLGIPHGAADLLVAVHNANKNQKQFSKIYFFSSYLGRLAVFAFLIWIAPILGIVLFILFAAYHFGETDLHQFKTSTIAGKSFVISYGLLIISIILLNQFESVVPLLEQMDFVSGNHPAVQWISDHRYSILTGIGTIFFISTFVYFYQSQQVEDNKGRFLLQLVVILIIIYNLPMLLAFTFYFIIWHSVLSLKNIFSFLGDDGNFKVSLILKQILIYSFLAIAGITFIGIGGIMFLNNDTLLMYVFIGLAVLTAPHLEVMHDMYKNLRQSKG